MTEDSSPLSAADLFAKVLEEDLANIVRKAAAGQPLTKREREMIEAEHDRLRHKEPREPVFELEGGGAPSPLDGLTQAEYATRWGYSLRQVKNWIQDGRAANDPVPLARPAEMPAWFERIYSPRQCPERLRLAVQRLLSEAESPAVESAPVTGAAERVTIDDSEKGMLAMLNRLREAEAKLHAKYLAQVDAGEEQKASFLFSEWQKAVEKLRALEKTAPKTLEELGIYVRKDEVSRELSQLHAAIIKAFRQALRLARPKLRATGTLAEWSAEADRLVDDVCLMLCETDFAQPLELEAA